MDALSAQGNLSEARPASLAHILRATTNSVAPGGQSTLLTTTAPSIGGSSQTRPIERRGWVNSYEQTWVNFRERQGRCFDRILLNGVIQPFQRPERVVGFFNTYRQLYPVTRQTLRGIAEQFQRWVSERAAMRKIPVIEAPKGRRDDFVDPYFERAKPDQVVVILKAREPARIMIAIGDKIANRW